METVWIALGWVAVSSVVVAFGLPFACGFYDAASAALRHWRDVRRARKEGGTER